MHDCSISSVPTFACYKLKLVNVWSRRPLLCFQFQHPDFGELQRNDFLWSLSNIPMLEGYLEAVDGEPLKEVVEGVIHQYRTSVIPKRSSFRRCEYIYAVCSHMLSPLYPVFLPAAFTVCFSSYWSWFCNPFNSITTDCICINVFNFF